MRVALLVLIVNGLVPGLGEVVESAVHFAVEGHLPHGDVECADLGDQGDEHGCGTTEHLCSCCVSLSFLAPAAGFAPLVAQPRPHGHRAGDRVASLDPPAPPLRPPIAS